MNTRARAKGDHQCCLGSANSHHLFFLYFCIVSFVLPHIVVIVVIVGWYQGPLGLLLFLHIYNLEGAEVFAFVGLIKDNDAVEVSPEPIFHLLISEVFDICERPEM